MKTTPQAFGMNRNRANLAALVAAIMAGVGALASGLVVYLLVFAGAPAIPRAYILPDPIGWALTPATSGLSLAAMVVAVVVLVGLTWLFVRLIVRSAVPGRMAATFFGTWGAVIVAAAIAGVVRTPLVLTALRIPAEQVEIFQSQFFVTSTVGVTWALLWGWVTALVVTMIHRSGGAAAPSHAAPATAAAYPIAATAPAASSNGEPVSFAPPAPPAS